MSVSLSRDTRQRGAMIPRLWRGYLPFIASTPSRDALSRSTSSRAPDSKCSLFFVCVSRKSTPVAAQLSPGESWQGKASRLTRDGRWITRASTCRKEEGISEDK